MPMMKSYTFFYFIHAYPHEQFAPGEICSKTPRVDDTQSDLGESLFSPSEKSVQEILNFSRSYEVLDSHLTERIEVIKN